MKYIFYFVSLISSISFAQISDRNNPEKKPNSVNNQFVDSLNGNSIEFYLNHKGIDNYAKLYYQGKFAVSDDSLTFRFLDSLLTDNSVTQPFYLFIFNSVLSIADGAVAEPMCTICYAFLLKYPCRFVDLKYENNYSSEFAKWLDFAAFEFLMVEEPNLEVEAKFNDLKEIVKLNCPSYQEDLELIERSIQEYIEKHAE